MVGSGGFQMSDLDCTAYFEMTESEISSSLWLSQVEIHILLFVFRF